MARKLWLGPTTAAWSVDAYWSPGGVPGAQDDVVVDGTASALSIAGPGRTATASVVGTVGLSGRIDAGLLTVGSVAAAGSLTLGAGAAVAVAAVALANGTLTVTGAGTSLSISGAISFGGAANGPSTARLAVREGAAVQAQSVTDAAGSVAVRTITVDSVSSFEVGVAGAAGRGTITIDAGQVLTASGTLVAENGVVNQGTLTAEGRLAVNGAVSGAGLFQIAAGSTLALLGTSLSYAPVVFSGAGSRLDTWTYANLGPGRQYSDLQGSATSGLIQQGILYGFARGDSIHYSGISFVYADAPVVAVRFTPGADGIGTLQMLGESGREQGAFRLAGDYAGSAFRIDAAANITLTAPTVRADLDGNARSNIVWQHSGGAIVDWAMDGAAITKGSPVATLGSDWTFLALADLNGDAKADMLWQQRGTGLIVDWTMDGPVIAASSPVGALGADWTFLGAGDLNGDQHADLLWRQAGSGTIVAWTMNGAGIVAGTALGALDADWQFLAVADLDGDGRADLLWQQRSTGTIVDWTMDGPRIAAGTAVGALPANWSLLAAADLNGDGRSDLIWQDRATGVIVDWTMQGATIASSAPVGSLDSSWSLVGSGDYNGDGRADLMWRNTAGLVVEWQMNGPAIQSGTAVSVLDTGWRPLG